MSRFTRRQFVQGSVAAGAALGVGFTPWRRALGANEELRVAVVGFRGRGKSHIGGALGYKGARLVALCDADKSVVDKGVSGYAKKAGGKIDGYQDMRRIFDRKDIDVVMTATPNHWHALTAIWAVQSGKDVYVEKPVSHNVWEGRQIVNAARKHNAIVQTGTQSRSSRSGIAQAVEWTQKGGLGKILYAVGTCYKPRKSIGKRSDPLNIPGHINYDLWCGPAEKRKLYRNSLHYDWHWDFNTGNGDIGNQGIHQMDIARWFLGETMVAPRVMSVGGRLGYKDAGDTPNTQIAFHDYPKAPLIFEVRGLPVDKAHQDHRWGRSMPNYRGSRIGVLVQCEGGHVLIPNYHSSAAYDKSGKKVKSWSGGGNHFANFFDAVKSRKRENLHAEIYEGHISSALCHLGNVSHQMGKTTPSKDIEKVVAASKAPHYIDSYARMADHLTKNQIDFAKTVTLGPWLELDPKKEQFTSNKAANKLLTREYRKPFVVPDLSDSVATKSG